MPTDEEKTVNGIRFTPMEYSMEMIVETERMFLREMNMGDYDALYQVLADPDRIFPEIGYHIHCDCRRKGYAKEAAKAVMDWAFRQCAREKQVETCGSCPEMKLCEKVGAIIGNNPEARGRLENAGSV